MNTKAIVVSTGVLLSCFVPGIAAAADDVAACVKASEQAQTLRDDAKYQQAREQLLVCSRDACPAIVRKDCVQWLGELDASMPSIVIAARDGTGKDLTEVKVTVDGKVLTERLEGKPIPIDPGKHTIHYEAAGSPPVEEVIVMHAGEKNRALTVKLGSAKPEPPSTGPGESAPEPPPASHGGIPAAALVLGGVGVLGLGSFAFFGITGKSDVNHLRDTCAPNCAQSDVDSAKTKLLVADISLGVGVVALGVATVMILSNGSGSSPSASGASAPVHLDATALPGGGMARIGGAF